MFGSLVQWFLNYVLWNTDAMQDVNYMYLENVYTKLGIH